MRYRLGLILYPMLTTDFLFSVHVYRMYYNHGMTDKGKIALRTAVVERDPNLCELRFAV